MDERIGPYRVLERLGSGGMGVVYLAERERGGEGPVALKVLHASGQEDEAFLARFGREARGGAMVEHPNVVRVLDAGEARQPSGARVPYLAMERVEGQTLRELRDGLGRVPEAFCRQIGLEVARGLAAIHAAGIVHRDVKPDNVMITADERVKIMDLGVASIAGDTARLTATGQFLGSLLYAAPEQLRGAGATPAMDLYALGVVLFELATADQPFAADDLAAVLARKRANELPAPSALAPGLSPFFDELVGALVATPPEERPAPATEVVRILEEGEGGAWWRERHAARALEAAAPVRPRVRREARLAGREAERARLAALFEAAEAGKGGTLLVRGESGLGKSRLVDEAVRRRVAEGRPLRVLHGGYTPGGDDPWSGLREALRAGLEPDVAGRLEALLGPTPDLVPAVKAFLTGGGLPGGALRLDPTALEPVLRRLLVGMAETEPLLLWIDDVHNASPEGLRLLGALAAGARTRPLALALTARPRLDAAWTAELLGRPGAEALELAHLDEAACADILADLLASEVLAADLAPELCRRAGGNPYLLLALVEEMRRRGLLRPGPEGLEAAASRSALLDLHVPTQVGEVLRGRLDALTDADRELLDLAACLGEVFDPLLVAQVAERPRIAVLRDLARLERETGLVRGLDRSFRFDHHAVLEVLRSALHVALREAYHGGIADVLRAAGGRDAEVVEHLVAAGREAEAAPLLAQVAEVLQRDFQPRRAEAMVAAVLAGGALAPAARLPLVRRRAQLLADLGRHAEEAALLDEAVRLAERLGDEGAHRQARLARAWNRTWRGLWDEALAETDEVAEGADAGRLPPADHAHVLRIRAEHAKHAGDMERALPLFAQGIEAFERAGVPERALGLRLSLGLMRAQRGEHDAARQAWQAARDQAEAHGHLEGLDIARSNLASLAFREGDFEAALATYAELLEAQRRRGVEWLLFHTHHVIARVLVHMGRYQEALEHHAQQETLLPDVDRAIARAALWTSRGDLHARLGDAAAAQEALQRGLRIAEEGDVPSQRARALIVFSRLALDVGRPTRALALLGEAMEVLDEAGLDEGRGAGRLLGARLRREAGETQPARRLLEALLDAPESLPGERLGARAALARLGREDPEAVREGLLREQHRLAAHERWAAWLDLWHASGKVDDLVRARAALEGVAAALPEALRARFREASPLCREIESRWRAAGRPAAREEPA